MSKRRIAVVGGGAAGFFAAIACAEAAPNAEIMLLEKGPQFLTKVRISGGGRCNVTHACFDPRELTGRFPRGERALIAPFQRFQARDTVEWFETRGVKLKIETDGRMFPTTDSSQTIIDCLLREAKSRGIKLWANRGAERVERRDGGFTLGLSNGEFLECDRLLLATGGCRTPAMGGLAVSLGHTLEPPVPSLFSLHVSEPWVGELAGLSVSDVEVFLPAIKLRERGPVLFTHQGLSGPAILRLSAWGARALHDSGYRFQLLVNWLPAISEESIRLELKASRDVHPARLVVNVALPPIPARLWGALAGTAGLGRETRWASLDRSQQHALTRQITRTEFSVSGKSLNKDEFVTCGGVRLGEVNFKTMESRICPGLYFAGELLDIDGITGGFNFQAAWTTGWIAGRSLAADPE